MSVGKTLVDNFRQHFVDLEEAAAAVPFRVFLCGPKISLHKKEPAAAVRSSLRDRLEAEGFDVILGEDEGLNNSEIEGLGINAQDNELIYIAKNCNAVIIVAGSVGSYCELGLFSWHFASPAGLFKSGTDFILIVDKKYRKHKSYFNLGPATSVNGGRGLICFVDFNKFDVRKLIKRLKDQRGITRATRAIPRKSGQ